MKRSWFTYLLIAGLAGLLVTLAVLQYKGLRQISEAEGEKAHKRVKDETEHFAADFNREIQGAYFNFQTEAESWKKKDWGAFNERYDYWHEKTTYPDLITDFYFFEAKGNAPPMKYDREKRAFIPVETSPALADLRAQASGEKTFKPVYVDTFTLALPVHDTIRREEHIIIHTIPAMTAPTMSMPERYGILAIKLNEKTIKEQILPDLSAKYFGDGEFRAAVSDKTGQPVYQSLKGETTDATAPLFDLSPDNFIQFTNKELLSSIGSERQSSNVIVNSHVENRTFNRTVSGDGKPTTFKIQVQGGERPRTSVFTTSSGGEENSPWSLLVQHSSGSLDASIANTLRRNLAMGFGILFLLAAAVAAIIISAQRSKMLARRQIDFVSSVSHEFRTPLAVIYSAGENLADGVAKEDEQVSRYGEMIKGEGKKLTSMVEQILEFAGANSGKQKYKFQPTQVADIIDNAMAECLRLVDEKKVRVEMNIAAGLPSVHADKRALSQAIQNLVANSIKYSDGSVWLRVGAENGYGKVKIWVEDRGIGISKSDLRQIFEPFYRAKSVVDAQIHGNGLGLSLVKQIAMAHGGKVTAVSETGKGSKFTIELPQKDI